MDLGENTGLVVIGSLYGLAVALIFVATIERDPSVKKGLLLAGIILAIGNSIGLAIPGPIGGFATAWGIVIFIGFWFLGAILLIVKLMR